MEVRLAVDGNRLMISLDTVFVNFMIRGETNHFLTDINKGGGSQFDCFIFVRYLRAFDWVNRFRCFFYLTDGASLPFCFVHFDSI